jgi:hypothetical protein
VKLGGDALGHLLGVVEQNADDDVRATTFIRGLVLGALVGAAIAGSTIWQRRHVRSMKPAVGAGRPASVSPDRPLDERPPAP